jgi:hypothetical protein
MGFSTFNPGGGSGGGGAQTVLNMVNPMDYGAFADGTNHAITAQDIAAHTGGGEKLWVGTIVRQVTDGVTTSGSRTITSATANFTSADVGQRIEGAGLPAGSRISAVFPADPTMATVNVFGFEATATATGVTFSIGDYIAGDQWDYVALQEAIFAAFQNSTSIPNKNNRWLNKQLYIPAGRYRVNKPPTMYEVEGGVVFGDGRLTTQIATIRAQYAAWECNGLWFTQFTGIQWFAGNGDKTDRLPLFDVDGHWDGLHLLGIQGNTWKDCHWDASFTMSPLFSMCRHGTNSQGSENLWLDCHFNNPGAYDPIANRKSGTAFINSTFNALQNTFIGGNFTQHIEGVLVAAGSINMLSVGFQAIKPDQIDYNGFDVHQNNSANGHVSMAHCRSESLKMLSCFNGSVTTLDSMAFDSAAPNGVWVHGHPYTLGQITQGITGGNGNGHLHICWQAGTSGAAEPVWNDSFGASGTNGFTREMQDAVMSVGSTNVNSPGGGFGGEGSFAVGKAVMVVAAGPSKANLYATCTAFIDGNNITIDTAASTAVGAARCIIGPKTIDGTAIWMHDEYCEADLNSPTFVRNCSFRWGYIRANGGGLSATGDAYWPVKFDGCNFARADALNASGMINSPISGVFTFPVVTTQDGKQYTNNHLTLNGGYNDGQLMGRIAPPSRAIALTTTSGTINMTTMSRAVYTLTPTGDCTINSTSAAANASAGGEAATFIITTSGTISRNITFGTNFISAGVLATGTVSGKRWTVSFKLFTDQITWVEICRNGPM